MPCRRRLSASGHGVRCPRVRCRVSGVRCPRVRCRVSGAGCPVSGVRASGAGCPVCRRPCPCVSRPCPPCPHGGVSGARRCGGAAPRLGRADFGVVARRIASSPVDCPSLCWLGRSWRRPCWARGGVGCGPGWCFGMRSGGGCGHVDRLPTRDSRLGVRIARQMAEGSRWGSGVRATFADVLYGCVHVIRRSSVADMRPTLTWAGPQVVTTVRGRCDGLWPGSPGSGRPLGSTARRACGPTAAQAYRERDRRGAGSALTCKNCGGRDRV
jgi:hypothetical protein